MVLDQQETFTGPAIALMAGPKLEYQSDQQAITKNGERRWVVQAAVSYRPDGQMPARAEVIEVGITGGQDPALTIMPGAQVQFTRLRCGISPPEKGENGRLRGGRPWFQADSVSAVNGHRAPVKVGES